MRFFCLLQRPRRVMIYLSSQGFHGTISRADEASFERRSEAETAGIAVRGQRHRAFR